MMALGIYKEKHFVLRILLPKRLTRAKSGVKISMQHRGKGWRWRLKGNLWSKSDFVQQNREPDKNQT